MPQRPPYNTKLLPKAHSSSSQSNPKSHQSLGHYIEHLARTPPDPQNRPGNFLRNSVLGSPIVGNNVADSRVKTVPFAESEEDLMGADGTQPDALVSHGFEAAFELGSAIG
ncbi:hypothetical protein COP2_027948 [Malus domestica]